MAAEPRGYIVRVQELAQAVSELQVIERLNVFIRDFEKVRHY